MSASAQAFELNKRWTILRPHPTQQAYFSSPYRFNTLPCGRRSGKTELAKRKLVIKALRQRTDWEGRFFAAAPTRDQAKRIYWDDLKALTRGVQAERPSESDLSIRLLTGAEIWVLGMDKPERIEGTPWDGGILDEYGNMKPGVWGANVRPALSDRLGWCDLIGVPEGRNHYYEVDLAAQAQMQEWGLRSEWGRYHWVSADILPTSEIEAARRDLDELTFAQEYEASFVNFAGRAYYAFDRAQNTDPRAVYDDRQILNFCLDFNVAPGVAVVTQELRIPGCNLDAESGVPQPTTCVIGEVYIPHNSNTELVATRLCHDWHHHIGAVRVYGDATGGNSGSAKLNGSDWDIAMRIFRAEFQERVTMRVKSSNPSPRARINALNTRCRAGDGRVRLLLNASKAPWTLKDLEGVRLVDGGSGEIDKKGDLTLTHLTDGLGYCIDYEHPVVQASSTQKLRL